MMLLCCSREGFSLIVIGSPLQDETHSSSVAFESSHENNPGGV